MDELQLDTHETALLQNAPVLRDPNGEPRLDADWMRLTTVGPVGSVRATGYVEVQGRTVAGIRFYDPAAARQPDLYASNLPLAEDGSQFRSYIATPPFVEYVSGHSAFSAASAEILRRFTGSDAFGASVTLAAGSSAIEPGIMPTRPVTLTWATFSEAGMSRRYGGIHFESGDLVGRALGRTVAELVWDQAQAFLTGAAASSQ